MIKSLKTNLPSTDFNLKALRRSWIRHPLNVVHCGAHLAQEADDYQRLGFNSVIWIEASSEFALAASQAVKKFSNQRVIHAALWNVSGVPLDLKIASNGASSSLRGFADHPVIFPDIEMVGIEKIITTTLDDILNDISERGGLLVLDLQGVELQALQGAEASLHKFDFVICEVSMKELYVDQCNWEEVSEELMRHGFILVDWTLNPNYGYGNALYARRDKYAPFLRILRRSITLFNVISISIWRRCFY